MTLALANYLDRRTGMFQHAGGAAGRVFVSQGDPCFFEGRQYFTFYELNIAQAASQVIKVVLTENVIMRDFFVAIDVSAARVEIVSGGTEGGTFGTGLTLQNLNNMTTAPDRASTTTMSTGGTHTGGTVLDLFLLNAGNNLNQAVGQQGGEAFPVGFPPGTYYARITNTGNATLTGLFKARWTETTYTA